MSHLNELHPFETSIEPNHEEGRSYLVLRHISSSSLPDGLRVPLAEGIDLMVSTFEMLANFAGGDLAMAQSHRGPQMVELMRKFVKSYDDLKAQEK